MTNENLIREVDDELRGDRLRAVWKRIGPFVIGGAVAVVLVVAGFEGWSWWQKSNAARSSEQFYAALALAEAGDVAGAQEALNAVTTEGTGSYPTLARFRQASLLAEAGNSEAAVAAYDALATAETNPRLRELALLLAAAQFIDSGNVGAVQQRVGTLAVDGHPMRTAARETLGLTQFKAGDLDSAVASLEAIMNDPLVSQETRSRIDIYVRQLISQGAASSVAAAEAPAETAIGEPELDVTEPAPADEAPAEAAPAGDAADEPAGQ